MRSISIDWALSQLNQVPAALWHAPDHPEAQTWLAFVRQITSTYFQASRVSQDLDHQASQTLEAHGGSSGGLSMSQEYWAYVDRLQKPERLIKFGFRFSGALDVKALRKSLREVLLENPILSCRPAIIDGNPGLERSAAPAAPLHIVQLHCNDATSLEEYVRRSECELNASAQVSAGVSWRLTLYQSTAGVHYLCGFVNHLLFDAYSADPFLRSLFYKYREAVLHVALPRVVAPSFEQFLGWECQNRSPNERLTSALHWAVGNLDVASSDKQQVHAFTVRSQAEAAKTATSLSSSQYTALTERCRRNRTTPMCLVGAVFASVLAGFLGRERLRYDVLISGRPSGFGQSIGCFAQRRQLVAYPVEDQLPTDFIVEAAVAYKNSLRAAGCMPTLFQLWSGEPTLTVNGWTSRRSISESQNIVLPDVAVQPWQPELQDSRVISEPWKLSLIQSQKELRLDLAFDRVQWTKNEAEALLQRSVSLLSGSADIARAHPNWGVASSTS
jgi:hypothetical protein